ncbi:hypothetical protein RC1_2949 [Rhodospirillum centenum SW]|uniref:Uncharacterized protein n=1 Tax=Rhodospirillum centenum (strain ATCC 51521 / SW) TaxID=414684 RepID=B6IVJ3_RHOCS|nr:hypothetical protein RC1_2949 [Rhodospirillum centenum SW]
MGVDTRSDNRDKAGCGISNDGTMYRPDLDDLDAVIAIARRRPKPAVQGLLTFGTS